MKRPLHLLPVLLLLLSAASLPAQSWRAVQGGTEAFFLCSHSPYSYSYYSDYLTGIKCDSVNGSGGDTLYYPYRTMLKDDTTSAYCNVNPAYPNLPGSRIRIDANSRHEFYTLNGDTITLRTNTAVGDTQTIYRWANGDLLLGIHASTALQSFANLTDSVKTYALQAVNASNVAIVSWWNGKSIAVSKSNGLVSIMSIRDFPADTMMLTRVKARRLTYGDIYTWQPGDELHESEDAVSMSNSQWNTSRLTNRYILSRTMINPDSVVFTIHDIGQYHTNAPPQTTYINDTVQLSIGRLSSFIQTAMPMQTIYDSTFTWSGYPAVYTYDLLLQNHDCGKLRMAEHQYNSISDTGSCVHYENFEPFIHDNHYVENVGGNFFVEWPHFFNNYSNVRCDFLYYNSPLFSCGTPVYVGVENLPAKEATRIYPNPATDQLTLEGVVAGTRVEIFDLRGQLISTSVADGKPIDVSMLDAGMYLLRLEGGAGGCFRFVKR